MFIEKCLVEVCYIRRRILIWLRNDSVSSWLLMTELDPPPHDIHIKKKRPRTTTTNLSYVVCWHLTFKIIANKIIMLSLA